jgi:sodium transport system ATP-binding protein
MALLEVKNLSKKFSGKKGEVEAVSNVTFSADKGEIFGLLGPNGAGKTTTIRLIATVLKPTGGTVVVDGFDVEKNSEGVRRNIGVLTTDIGLYDRFSARENLRYFGELYGMSGQKLEDRINELLDILEMKDFADRRAGKFSTGMKQKVAIARSIIHDPEVIIFDEPTAGLDVLASQTVVRFMQKARAMGRLVILSTHEMYDAEKLCSRVGIIYRGKMEYLGTVDDIKSKTGTQSLEDAFLKIINDSPKLENEKSEIRADEKPKIFSKQGITLAGKIIPWWRLILAAVIIVGVLVYKFIVKK